MRANSKYSDTKLRTLQSKNWERERNRQNATVLYPDLEKMILITCEMEWSQYEQGFVPYYYWPFLMIFWSFAAASVLSASKKSSNMAKILKKEKSPLLSCAQPIILPWHFQNSGGCIPVPSLSTSLFSLVLVSRNSQSEWVNVWLR